jgi:hypothetical protein
MVLALVVAVMVAAPVGAKKKVWEGQTCAQVFGTTYEWDTSEADTYPDTLTLTKAAATACIDLTTVGGNFTVKFPNKDANVTVFYAIVRDSVPGSQCDPDGVVSNTTGKDLKLFGVPNSVPDACWEYDPDRYPDRYEPLALFVGAQFKGRPVGSVDVAITYDS